MDETRKAGGPHTLVHSQMLKQTQERIAALEADLAAERKRREGAEADRDTALVELGKESGRALAALARAEQAERERDEAREAFNRLRSAIDAEPSGAEKIHAALMAAGISEEDEVSGVIGLEEHVARALERMRKQDDDICRMAEEIEAWKSATGLERGGDPDGVRPADLTREMERMRALEASINTPETEDFMRGVPLEAAHQQQRWGTKHDAGKTDADWFWLVGYLAGKALRPGIEPEKRRHHLIATAAACLNWHRYTFGQGVMRPGIAPAPDGS